MCAGRAVALHVDLVEIHARSWRAVRVEPGEHARHVVRPVLPLHPERGGAGDVPGAARRKRWSHRDARARSARFREGAWPSRRPAARAARRRPHQQRGRFRREQRDEGEPVLDAAEDWRGPDDERQQRRRGEAQLEQPLRVGAQAGEAQQKRSAAAASSTTSGSGSTSASTTTGYSIGNGGARRTWPKYHQA